MVGRDAGVEPGISLEVRVSEADDTPPGVLRGAPPPRRVARRPAAREDATLGAYLAGIVGQLPARSGGGLQGCPAGASAGDVGGAAVVLERPADSTSLTAAVSRWSTVGYGLAQGYRTQGAAPRGPPRSTGAGEGSMPCDRVANAVVKNRNRLRSHGVHALREQRVDLGVLEREVAGDADAVRDVDAEVVGREG